MKNSSKKCWMQFRIFGGTDARLFDIAVDEEHPDAVKILTRQSFDYEAKTNHFFIEIQAIRCVWQVMRCVDRSWKKRLPLRDRFVPNKCFLTKYIYNMWIQGTHQLKCYPTKTENMVSFRNLHTYLDDHQLSIVFSSSYKCWCEGHITKQMLFINRKFKQHYSSDSRL